jgi:hypothetical protein
MKTRLPLRKTGEYRGMFDCAKKLYSADGFKVSTFLDFVTDTPDA